MTASLVDHRSYGEAFAACVADRPDQTALTLFRGDTEEEQESLTYAELDRRAGHHSEGLAQRYAPGERVVIALPTSSAFLELYLASLRAGLVAVPAPTPGTSASVERIAAIAADCAPALILTTERDVGTVAEQLRARGLGHLLVEPVPPVPSGAAAGPAWGERTSGPGDVAVLQYSSGSTGTPKGVILTHSAILANLAALGAYGDIGPHDRFGIWLPLHHDMGLFGQLSMALLAGAPTALMSPTLFVRRPAEWMRMMSRFRTTITAAPSFAYELCVRLIAADAVNGLDLSALRYAFNGSESVGVDTMRAFTARFAHIGLSPLVVAPCYGMSECTAYISAKAGDAAPTVVMADRVRLAAADDAELRPVDAEPAGGPVAGHQIAEPSTAGQPVAGLGVATAFDVRIVDPDRRRGLPDGRIGEIWLRGPSIGRGYWNRPELTAAVFAATLADDGTDAPGVDSGGWLRTGDLGALRDGELFVVGRLKELIIVNGRNLWPQDVEQEARAAHDALTGQVGAAFGVAGRHERIVLVHEVNPRTPASDLPDVVSAIRRRLTASLGVPVRNVVLVRRGTVHRTTSGKIKRAAMRQRFLEGQIPTLHADLDADLAPARGDAVL